MLQTAEDGSGQGEFEPLDDEEQAVRKRLRSLTQMRAFHERQVSLIERLPAAEVAGFLDSQRARAAARIQTWWRKRGREEGRPTPGDVGHQEFFGRERQIFPLGREMERGEREQLQAEVDRYQRENPPPAHSEEEMRRTHEEVQQLLSQFYSRQQVTESESGKAREESVLLRLEEDCRLLLGAPKLGELERGEEVDQKFFTAGSQTVVLMAQRMHQKEMKAAGLTYTSK